MTDLQGIEGRQARVVFVTYRFPPCVAWPTSAARAAGFARYLPEFGWTPMVVTPAINPRVCPCPACAATVGWAGQEEPPGVLIRRVDIEPKWAAIRHPGKRQGRPAGPSRAFEWLGSKLGRLMQLVGDETGSTWGTVVEEEVARIIEEWKPDVVWTTYGPRTSLRVGSRLRQRYPVAWVADLRDGLKAGRGARGMGAVLLRLGNLRARRWLKHADVVVAVSPQLAARDGEWLRRPVVTIPSGFDPEDFAGFGDRRPGDGLVTDGKFTVSFLGALTANWITPETFMEGLAEFFEHVGASGRQDSRLVYCGHKGADFKRYGRRAGVEDVVVDMGFVPPARARAIAAGSQILLLCTNTRGDHGIPGGKLYEYLAAGRPILAVPGRDAFVSEVLRSTGAGGEAESPRDVATVLGTAYEEWRRTGTVSYFGDRDAIMGYSMRTRAQSLAGCLEDARLAAGSG